MGFHRDSSVSKMGKKFYGLRGLHLNIAIAVVAGVDFALFGYDQVSPCHFHIHSRSAKTNHQGRVLWVCDRSERLHN